MFTASTLAFLGCLVLQVRSQQDCANTQTCDSGCFAESGSCCLLDEQSNTDDTPLGYIVQFLPGTDTDLAFPCALVEFPAEAMNQNMVNYLVVAVSGVGSEWSGRGHGVGVVMGLSVRGCYFLFHNFFCLPLLFRLRPKALPCGELPIPTHPHTHTCTHTHAHMSHDAFSLTAFGRQAVQW